MKKNPYDKYLGKEDILQIQVLTWLKMQYPNVLVLHPPNEGKRSPFERWKAKRMGLVSGWPDIMIFQTIHTGRIGEIYYGCAIELKVRSNSATKNQKAMLENLEAVGWQAHVCYDFDSTCEVIKNYLG